jgi:hypothetical protein
MVLTVPSGLGLRPVVPRAGRLQSGAVTMTPAPARAPEPVPASGPGEVRLPDPVSSAAP